MKPIRILGGAFALLALASTPALAVGIEGLDVMSSTVMQEGQSSFSGLGARARLQADQLVPQIDIMPYAEYWRNSSTVQPYDIRSTRKDATLGVDAIFKFSDNAWQPYVGVGYGIHFLSSRVQAPQLGVEDASSSLVKGGMSALAGMNLGLTQSIDNFLELKYHHVTEYRQLKFNWGLTFKL